MLIAFEDHFDSIKALRTNRKGALDIQPSQIESSLRLCSLEFG